MACMIFHDSQTETASLERMTEWDPQQMCALQPSLTNDCFNRSDEKNFATNSSKPSHFVPPSVALAQLLVREANSQSICATIRECGKGPWVNVYKDDQFAYIPWANVYKDDQFTYIPWANVYKDNQ